MALLAGAMCGVRNDSCSRKHKYARTSHGMASESLSRGVDLFCAKEFCFFKQEQGPPRGSKQAKTDVLLTTVLGPLRWAAGARLVTDWLVECCVRARGGPAADSRVGGRAGHHFWSPFLATGPRAAVATGVCVATACLLELRQPRRCGS